MKTFSPLMDGIENLGRGSMEVKDQGQVLCILVGGMIDLVECWWRKSFHCAVVMDEESIGHTKGNIHDFSCIVESQFQSLEGFHEDVIEGKNSREDDIPFLSASDKDLEELEQLSGSLSCLVEFGQHLLETYH